MAFPPHSKTDETGSPTVTIVEEVQDAELGHTPPRQPSAFIPRWPRVLSASTHVLVVLLSTVIIGLGAHTLTGYSATRGIHFGGVNNSWPTGLNVHPIYISLTISAMGLIVSIPSAILTLRRLKLPTFSNLEVTSTMISLVMLLLWLASDFLQHQSELTPKKDLRSWACRRTDSPTNALVRYQTICQEQVSRHPYLACRALLTTIRTLSRVLPS